MKKNTLISIIVPVYNVEPYLDKCLNSIVSQTYKNIEIIIINDGSTDNSYDICKLYECKDNRIKLINQENKGLSDARNVGIMNSSADYITFVDSDDYISKDFVTSLYETMLEYNADIVVCNYKKVYKNNNTKVNLKSKKNKKSIKHYSNIEAVEDILSGNFYLNNVVWNKLFKKSLFLDNDVLFPSKKIYEDTFVMYKLFYYSNTIILLNEVLYYYLIRAGSITKQKYNTRMLDILDVLKEQKKFILDKNLDINIDLIEIKTFIRILYSMIYSRYNGFDKKNIIESIYHNRKKYYFSKNVTNFIKLKTFIILNFYFLFEFLVKIKGYIKKLVKKI